MGKTYRIGAVGALMDEYERATLELSGLVSRLDDNAFELVRDTQTQDEHCRSIQTIMSHVVNSGHGYAGYIRRAFSLPSTPYVFAILSRSECAAQLESMLASTVDTLDGRWQYSDEQMMAVQIDSRWGQHYDLEQLLEHAIVHILRHRRQIERFLAR